MNRQWTIAAGATAVFVLATATASLGSPVAMGASERIVSTASSQPDWNSQYGWDRSSATAAVAPPAGLGAASPRTIPGQANVVQELFPRTDAPHGAPGTPAYVHDGPLQGEFAMDHPVAGPYRMSSAFGWRTNPTNVGPALQFHIGQDYAVACGTPVQASADGTVTFSGEKGTAGLRVDIDHEGGLATAYRHNSVLLVEPGNQVSRGDVIALSGTTGNSTGCHVHFEVTLDGKYIDPVLVLPSSGGQPRPLTEADLERIRTAPQNGIKDSSESGRLEAVTKPAESGSAKPSPTSSSSPRPNKPADDAGPSPTRAPSPSAPATASPSAPEPSPSTDAPSASSSPSPTDSTEPSATPTPESTDGPEGENLPGVEASQWCVIHEDGERPVITSETDLSTVIAVRDANGDLEPLDEALLAKAGPGQDWLDLLSGC